MIELWGVSKRFAGGRTALEDVTFEIPAGQFAYLKGASGAGKSTLLGLIFGQLRPTSGRILVNGRDLAALPDKQIPYLRRGIGVVFQDYCLISRKTVLENVGYLPRILGASSREQRRLARLTLSRVGLEHRMNAFPHELSGGEQQRVAIARALVNQPPILIADEPTGNLDPALSEEILSLFVDIHRQGTTILLATHDPNVVHRPGDRILMLERGRLVRDRQVAGRPDNPRSAPPPAADLLLAPEPS